MGIHMPSPAILNFISRKVIVIIDVNFFILKGLSEESEESEE